MKIGGAPSAVGQDGAVALKQERTQLGGARGCGVHVALRPETECPLRFSALSACLGSFLVPALPV